MASQSHKTPQVRFKPTPLLYCITHNLLACLDPSLKSDISTMYVNNKQMFYYKKMDSTLRYRIGREVNRPSKNRQILSNAISILTLKYDMQLLPQDNDQDMADSSCPTNLKRGQLTIQQSIQQKKMRSNLQSEHQSYANQDTWLGFQTMELLAIDNDIPP
jgi:hypothetical protein